MKAALDRLAQKLAPGDRLGWHSHAAPYAAVVLDGGYVEAGDGGRRRVEAGHVVIHTPFAAHGDQVGSRGAVVANLPLAVGLSLRLTSGIVADPEALVRTVADDPAAIGPLLGAAAPAPAAPADLPDRLAAAIDRAEAPTLAEWAAGQAVSPRSVTRAFTAAFGIAPAHYRWRARVQGAWRSIVISDLSLAAIAHDWGFADQPHMTRAVVKLTGHPPGYWRRSPLLSD